jgi:hypothetical protein
MTDDKITKLSVEVASIKDTLQDVSKKMDSVESNVTDNKIAFREHAAVEDFKYSSISKSLEDINDRLVEQNKDWREHMLRTKTNEIAIDELKKMNTAFDARLLPIEKKEYAKISIKKAIAWSFGVAASIATIIGSFLVLK